MVLKSYAEDVGIMILRNIGTHLEIHDVNPEDTTWT
jgi:hypothetical protein